MRLAALMTLHIPHVEQNYIPPVFQHQRHCVSTPSHKLCSLSGVLCTTNTQARGGGVHTCGLATTVEFTLWIVRPYALPDAP